MATELMTHTDTHGCFVVDYSTILYPQLIQKGCLRLFVTVNRTVITTDAMQVTWTEEVAVSAEEGEESPKPCHVSRFQGCEST